MNAVKKPRPSRSEHVVSFWLGQEMREKIAEIATRRGISRSELVRLAVESYIAKAGVK